MATAMQMLQKMQSKSLLLTRGGEGVMLVQGIHTPWGEPQNDIQGLKFRSLWCILLLVLHATCKGRGVDFYLNQPWLY